MIDIKLGRTLKNNYGEPKYFIKASVDITEVLNDDGTLSCRKASYLVHLAATKAIDSIRFTHNIDSDDIWVDREAVRRAFPEETTIIFTNRESIIYRHDSEDTSDLNKLLQSRLESYKASGVDLDAAIAY